MQRVVIHLLSEQPVLADLLEDPTPTDLNLICTNLRTLDGRRPVFVESSGSTFVFPYLHIRFLEIHAAGTDSAGRPRDEVVEGRPAAPVPAGDEDVEIDEDFLRRVREV